jgi:hypothetical protein
MIRAVGLALWFLAGSGAAIAISVGQAPEPENTSTVLDEPSTDTHSVNIVPDTLTETDRLNVAYVRSVVENAKPAPFVVIPADLTLDKPKTVSTVANRRLRGTDSKTHAAPSPTRQSKSRAPKATKVAHAKASVAFKPCRRPEGFAGFLRLLNLGPRCET